MCKRTLTYILLFISIIMLAACASPEAASTPTLPPPPTIVVAGEAALAPPPTPETAPVATPTIDYNTLAGRYPLPLKVEYADEQTYLVLEPDGTGRIEDESFDIDQTAVAAQGTWVPEGDGVAFTITELLGQPATPDTIKFELVDGEVRVTEYAAEGSLYNVEMAQVSIGAGQRHPLVNELHARLAAIDYLNFTDPGDDLYTEATRQAVVEFQRSMGIEPDGVVDATTWVLLGNPPEPLPTPEPPVVVAPPEIAGGIPDLSALSTHTADGNPILYFTFDDGPSLPYTGQVVELMDRYNGNATFFALGQNVSALPDSVRTATQSGHYIANHTWDHASLEEMTPEQFMDEVQRTEDAIINAAGDLFALDKDVRYLRPPYGATDANTRNYAASLGYAVVLWTIDTQDWRLPGTDIIAQHILNSVYPGAIILMHDGGGDRSQSVAALETVLPQLSAQGYVFRNIFGS